MKVLHHISAKTLTIVMGMTLSVVFSPTFAMASLTPLSEGEREILQGIPEDPAPKSLVRGNHYVVSNENRPHLFKEAIEKRGGVLVGVGTDQLYFYAGWARSELVIPMDFDKAVVDLHRVYALLFAKAETPDAFIQLWHKRNVKQVHEWIKAAHPDPNLQERMRYAFKISRVLVHARLKRMQKRYKKGTSPSFLNDQSQYDHLVSLVKAGRIYPIRGDLTKRGCLAGIGQALVKLGHTLDVIYLSNAEQYFAFEAPFRENFLALPVDDASLVLRTAPRNRDKGEYNYEIQRTVDFQAWLKRPKITRVKQIRWKKKRGAQKDSFIFPAPND